MNEFVSTVETVMHNTNVIALHIATCRNCKEELEEDPTLQAHIDSYITCHKWLTERDVHRTVYYGYCPLGLDGLTDEAGSPIGYYHQSKLYEDE